VDIMVGAIRTRRWNDPPEPGDGLRLLVTRYRPRGVAKRDETWDEWWPDLGPSRKLHAAYWGKGGGEPIGWETYRQRYLEEMTAPGSRFRMRALANRVAAGETVTLLCSSACADEGRCHRSVLAALVERMIKTS
jgi:uncharacterized protein YeaO (DUF488 family)